MQPAATVDEFARAVVPDPGLGEFLTVGDEVIAPLQTIEAVQNDLHTVTQYVADVIPEVAVWCFLISAASSLFAARRGDVAFSRIVDRRWGQDILCWGQGQGDNFGFPYLSRTCGFQISQQPGGDFAGDGLTVIFLKAADGLTRAGAGATIRGTGIIAKPNFIPTSC